MAPQLLRWRAMKAKRPKTKRRAHDTPVLGPRRRPTKVQALPARAPRGGEYDPGVPEPRPRSPWIDEGEPEPNG
jgi:hypothetical protein